MAKKENTKPTVKEKKSATRPSVKRGSAATTKTPPKTKKPKVDKAAKTEEVQVIDHVTLFSDYDIHLFKEGKHYELYTKLGSHVITHKGVKGTYFALWAPNAEKVSVIGDFNHWKRNEYPMNVRHDGSGIWETFIPGIGEGTIYKYFIESRHGEYKVEKGDPFAFKWEIPPNTASIIWDITSTWSDKAWMEKRKKNAGKPQPFSVYELHLGSWRRVPEDNNRSLSYREMATELPAYVKKMGFTHVEFMPVMEHPFFGSWGYQITGYFAPSSRFGSPQDFMHLIDALHREGIGVILDWVPSHFPSDQHGLHYFDGTFLFEHADPRKGYHPDWKSYIFNYGRNEVRAFLISNAMYWLEKYHIDGLRVDAVASMLYLDYSRKAGEWEPNEYGGNENLDAISFLKEFNEAVYAKFPDVHTIAEESTSWPMVSRPTYIGGLGFGMKWMMGWMHDTLEYFKKDPVHRQHHQNEITFSAYYAFTENFMLPLSHDEVVYGKNPLLYKMPGDEWQQFANLRALYGYMYAHPGAKLLFMGGEFGQTSEWAHDNSLDWHLTDYPLHQGLQQELTALNQLYKTEKALYEISFEEAGFEWIDIHDALNSVISFVRKGKSDKQQVLVICNFTPVLRENYRVGVPKKGFWKEVFNSDDQAYGGSHVKNNEAIASEPLQAHGRDNSITLTLPPLGVVYLKFSEK
ncbi:1,4-alpha-glucan branching protein GlgB [Fulvivirga kasyanovii]|uniref:1,4-alpha-glucan branching enzyme GlgB n=1 Tax=Fulvivirga kasyanovii TaxID=396812 RepID=A0ABW9RWA9_9BACT|nr:1,4-alpha-glucan branching protein GlgB [Fulvivirga kasyanovii]MTI27513.1 1,4-alpha-glucan branching protein GlgB [Fulvivirga kasyanovii]